MEEIKKLGVDKILSVNFGVNLNYEPKNIYEVAFKSIDVICNKISEESIKQSDILIDLDLSKASVFNIKKIDYCYNMGYIKTLANIKKIKEILQK